MNNFRDFIEEVRNHSDIVQIIGSDLELQSAGKNLQFTHVVIFDALTGKVQKVKGRTIKSIEHILDEEVPGWKLVKDIAA